MLGARPTYRGSCSWTRFDGQEAAVLSSIGIDRPLELVTIDEDCPMVTPLHRIAGQLRELARIEKHGSTGMGSGETTRLHRELGDGYVPMAADLQRPAKLAAKLNDLRNYLLGDLRDLRHADALTRKIYLDLVDYDLRMLASTYETIAKVVRVGVRRLSALHPQDRLHHL